ncbi:hypothetical protein WN943_016132 [Citrus x changshan-huyou]
MEPMNFLVTDCESILSDIKRQEKQLKRKRRWLMGLTASKSEKHWSKGPKFLKEHRSLPESLLREDDILFENVKTCVEESFGAYSTGNEHIVTQDNMQLFDMRNIRTILISCLNTLTNKGLYHIAMMLTGGLVKFEKTRRQMKRVIRESLPIFHRNRNHHCREIMLKQLSALLNDPKNFRENCFTFLTPTLQSHYATIIRILDGLEDLPYEALITMHRKLRDVGRMPQLRHHKQKRNRGYIIEQIRKMSKKMLSELGKRDELQEPLGKAMAVAGLSLKLEPGCQNSSDMGFHQFSPEIKNLQNEIVKAIWLIKTKVGASELKNLQKMLDRNADLSNKCLRTAIKKMLIEYLFECSNMDTIPKSLLKALAVINENSRSISHRCLPGEEIEQEVECVLSVSAQMRQIVWDFLPDYELDQDFTDAYMEELEESDDGDDDDSSDGDVDNDSRHPEFGSLQSSRFPSVESDYKIEGIGESMPVYCTQPASGTQENGSSAHLTPSERVNGNSFGKIEPEDWTNVATNPHGTTSSLHFLGSRFLHGRVNMDISQGQAESSGKVFSSRSMDFFSSNFVSEDTKIFPCKPSLFRNQYLAIQEACDETSMVAYNLIGCMLEKFAQEDEVDLDSSDSSYLRGSSTQENTRGANQTSYEDVGGSDIVPMVKELMTSFSKRYFCLCS